MYQRLRDLREDHDKTQKDIASMLNISQTTYSRYESGALDIPSATIIRLARFYHVSTDYLFGLTDEDRPYPRGSMVVNGGERSNAALAGTIETESSEVGAMLTRSAMGWIIQKGGALPLLFGR